ncbi:MAG: vitamin B12 dependent-methionine synthase activation domain-containing protein [Saprospiraceae bacterium]
MIKETYRGIRPAPGYPACPEHTEKLKLWELLGVKETIGVELTESMAMYPAASVSGWYFSHPESKYFGVGEIAEDQRLQKERKNWSDEDAEKWLKEVVLADKIFEMNPRIKLINETLRIDNLTVELSRVDNVDELYDSIIEKGRSMRISR